MIKYKDQDLNRNKIFMTKSSILVESEDDAVRVNGLRFFVKGINKMLSFSMEVFIKVTTEELLNYKIDDAVDVTSLVSDEDIVIGTDNLFQYLDKEDLKFTITRLDDNNFNFKVMSLFHEITIDIDFLLDKIRELY